MSILDAPVAEVFSTLPSSINLSRSLRLCFKPLRPLLVSSGGPPSWDILHRLEFSRDEGAFEDLRLWRGPNIKDFDAFISVKWWPKSVSKFSLILPGLCKWTVVPPAAPTILLLGVALKFIGEYYASLVCYLDIGDMFKFGMRVSEDTGASDLSSSWSPSSSWMGEHLWHLIMLIMFYDICTPIGITGLTTKLFRSSFYYASLFSYYIEVFSKNDEVCCQGYELTAWFYPASMLPPPY